MEIKLNDKITLNWQGKERQFEVVVISNGKYQLFNKYVVSIWMTKEEISKYQV